MEQEEIRLQISEAQKNMDNTIEFLKNDLAKVRAGRANPTLLNDLKVNCYGTHMPINQIATINTPDNKTIAIQPWDNNLIKEIEKTIMNSDLGLNPLIDGTLIRITIPELTEERRKELVKLIKNKGEDTRVSIRNARRQTIDVFKKMETEGLSKDFRHDAESEIQKLTDEYINTINELIDEKEKEIMTI